MSKVKLIVQNPKNNAPDGSNAEIVRVESRIGEELEIIGVVRTDFDEDPTDHTKRASDDIAMVLSTNDINVITGRILTLVDAVLADPEQRKATKDLVRQSIWNWYTNNLDWLTPAWRKDRDNA